ncbi:ATP-dependent RNA helicase mak5 [Bienertia sinuspersici]
MEKEEETNRVTHNDYGLAIHKVERRNYSKSEKRCLRLKKFNTLIKYSDVICKSELRVYRRTFGIIYELVRDIGGLSEIQNMSIEEIIAMTVGNYFFRSGESLSQNFHRHRLAILKLHEHILKKPTPITEECEDDWWKIFKDSDDEMAMDVGQVSKEGRVKNKRSWIKAEDNVLIDGLLEMSNDLSWKADGNFKSRFRNKLEEKLNEKFLGCGLKTNPHIDLKINWFKDKYNVLTDMFRTSGFSWNEEKKMILCER